MLGGEFVIDVAAQSKTFAQDLAHGCGKEIWPGSGTRRVILGDQAAYGHARKLVEQGQHSLPNGTADVFEINVDPIRTGSCKPFDKVRCTMIDSGEVEIGFQQVSELIHEKGIDYLGPLPSEVQNITVFSAGLHTGAKAPEAAKTLIKALTGPDAATVIKAHGMEPG